MVQNWQDLQQAQAEASEAIAGVAVDLAGQMDEFQRLLVEDIEAMDLGDEAANSGIATIQGYIDGASGMLSQVKAAYRNIAEAAQNELSIFGATATLNFGAYAAGTESAAPGLALVGERGPEIVMFNGGEKVLNAMQTAAMQDSLAANALQVTSFAPVFMEALQAHRALDATHAVGAAVSVQGSAPIQISAPVSITVEGDASPETVGQLERYGSEFESRVLDVLEKAVEEQARRAYR